MVYAVLVVFAGCAALVTAQGLQNIPQQLQGLAAPTANVPQQGLEAVQNILGELTSRLGDAYVSTYDNTKDNVYDTLDTIKETGQKGIESSVKLFKNGVGLFFLLPQFGRNFFSNQPFTRSNQYPATQYLPQLQQIPQIPQVPQFRY